MSRKKRKHYRHGYCKPYNDADFWADGKSKFRLATYQLDSRTTCGIRAEICPCCGEWFYDGKIIPWNGAPLTFKCRSCGAILKSWIEHTHGKKAWSTQVRTRRANPAPHDRKKGSNHGFI